MEHIIPLHISHTYCLWKHSSSRRHIISQPVALYKCRIQQLHHCTGTKMV